MRRVGWTLRSVDAAVPRRARVIHVRKGSFLKKLLALVRNCEDGFIATTIFFPVVFSYCCGTSTTTRGVSASSMWRSAGCHRDVNGIRHALVITEWALTDACPGWRQADWNLHG
jgi:hypothetical protein